MKFLALLLFGLVLCLPAPAAATSFGVFPGLRYGWGRANYLSNDVISQNPANGTSTTATMGELSLNAVATFDKSASLGVQLTWTEAYVDNPKDNLGDTFKLSGWGIAALGMYSVLDWAYVSGHLGYVSGTAEGWMNDNQGTSALKLGAGFHVPVLHNDGGSIALGLVIDYLRSGTLTGFGPNDARFAATVVGLDVTAAFAVPSMGD